MNAFTNTQMTQNRNGTEQLKAIMIITMITVMRAKREAYFHLSIVCIIRNNDKHKERNKYNSHRRMFCDSIT